MAISTPNPISIAAIAELARAEGYFGVFRRIEAVGSPREVAEAYRELHLDAYWKHKNLSVAATVAAAGVQFCLTAAKWAATPDEIIELKAAAKGLAYNLGSFTWPGWDEPGIAPTAEQMALGLDAARLNLALALELNKPAEKVRFAHWLLGAQLLAVRGAEAYEQACAEFQQAVPPESDEHFALYEGYVVMMRLLMKQPGAEAQWQAHLSALAERTDDAGKFAHPQLVTAHRVFTAVKQ